jgi:spore germination cell wall hydrolase CwlJ-like protein
MLITIGSQDLALCARTVKALALEQPDDLKAALAWTLRNRITALAQTARPRAHDVCLALLREATALASPKLPRTPAASDTDWSRTMAINNLVWNGELADPTNGATSCHRHDITVRWAARRVATALIGAYIFLR